MTPALPRLSHGTAHPPPLGGSRHPPSRPPAEAARRLRGQVPGPLRGAGAAAAAGGGRALGGWCEEGRFAGGEPARRRPAPPRRVPRRERPPPRSAPVRSRPAPPAGAPGWGVPEVDGGTAGPPPPASPSRRCRPLCKTWDRSRRAGAGPSGGAGRAERGTAPAGRVGRVYMGAARGAAEFPQFARCCAAAAVAAWARHPPSRPPRREGDGTISDLKQTAPSYLVVAFPNPPRRAGSFGPSCISDHYRI